MNFDWLRAIWGGLATLSLGGSLFLLGWAVAVRVVAAEARSSVRWSAAALVSFFFATVSFWLLASCGLFRLVVVLPWCLLAAGLAWRQANRTGKAGVQLAVDFETAVRVVRRVLKSPSGWLLGAVLAIAGLGILRGMVAPPLGWDGLTYHLVKAGRFVQTGAFVAEQAPNYWQFYEYFPVGGDLLWAWALLPFPSGLLIASMGFGVWGTALLALYATARELGASAQVATAVAAAVGAMPAAVVLLPTANVDNASLLYFALSSLFLLRSARGALSEVLLAAAALGCMAGVRLTMVPLTALGGLMLLWWIVGSTASWRRRGALAGICLAFSLVGAPTYVRSWIERGSPLFPLRFEVSGTVLSAGDSEFERAASWVMADYPLEDPAREFWRRLFYLPSSDDSFINLGPGAFLLPWLAGLAVWPLVRRRQWLPLLWFGAASAVILGAVLTEGMAAFRLSSWANQVGRLLLPGVASLALLAGATTSRRRAIWFQISLLVVAFGGLLWARPRGLSFAEGTGLGAMVALLFAAWGSMRMVRRAERQGTPRDYARVLAAAVMILLLSAADRLRASQRYPLYEDTAQLAGGVFHSHPLLNLLAESWPVWRELDQPEPLRVAPFTGWDDTTVNNYRFPLMGSRLQNDVRYVPITRDGSIINGVDLAAQHDRADYPAWINRLLAEQVDVVVQLYPGNGIEAEWMQGASELFERTFAAPDGYSAIYRFHRERLPATGLPAETPPPKAAVAPISGSPDSNRPAGRRRVPVHGQPE